jgi:fatty-acyl-CoA synthase
MRSTMMDEPLGTRLIAERGERLFDRSTILTFDGQEFTSATFAEVANRARRLASGLKSIGVGDGDRVATFLWNRQEHLEAYLAVPSMGAVLHTLNVRLFPEQIGWIIDHAEDKVLLVDSSLLSSIASILADRPSLQHVAVVGDWDGAEPPGLEARIGRYDDLLDHPPLDQWPLIDEWSAAAMCYTSGTTGNPKGVVYSHRSIFLHSLASMASDAFGISNRDRILMVPAMFHANAWGMPFSGWLAGADMVMPGPHLQPDNIARMAAEARPTLTAAVPTILNDLLALAEKETINLSSFRGIIAGGSAVSQQLIDRMKQVFGVDVVQGWGMTETSPMCVLSTPPRGTPANEESVWRSKSGRPVAGMKVRIVDDGGRCLPEDGSAVGRLQLRGPWVTSGYYREESGQSPLTADGWLDTGDVGTIDDLGFVQITDRTKDLIKSGGEWISSIDLEEGIARLPGIKAAAVIAVPDPRWEERPLAIVVPSRDGKCDFASLRSMLSKRIAKFMVPEYWTQLEDLPTTSVGKVDKQRLRSDARRGALPYVRETGLRKLTSHE